MIVGLGNDLVELIRVEGAIKRHADSFLRRVLSEGEQTQARTFAHARLVEFVAGRFAAKEAIAKATGIGLAKLCMSTVSIFVEPTGLRVHWTGDSGLRTLSKDDVLHVSISHTATLAFAVAILERMPMSLDEA